MIYQLTVQATVPGVEEIRILEWHKSAGDPVAPGDLLVELETHKAVIEVRAAQIGIVRQILAVDGDWRMLGKPLAIFSTTADEVLPTDTDSAPALLADFAVT